MSTFDIALRTESSLHPHRDPDRFITEHRGGIRRTRDRDGKVSAVGLVQAQRIHVDLAQQAGVSLFDVCDAHSQEMHDLYAALFDTETDDLKEEVRACYDASDNDILVLDYVLLSPRWRGLKLGLMAARSLIDLLGGGCGLAVSWVYPLNGEAAELGKVPAGWIPRHAAGLPLRPLVGRRRPPADVSPSSSSRRRASGPPWLPSSVPSSPSSCPCPESCCPSP
jgi:hypothetical protein